MRISILDPGLNRLVGHHFDLDRRLIRALADRGHEAAVYGHVSLPPELTQMAEEVGMPLHATFRVHPYAQLPDVESAIDAYRGLANATAADLARVPLTDLWIWPTLAPYQFMAALLQTGPAQQIGGVWFSPRYPNPIGARCWAHAARRVADVHCPIIIGAYDELLCELYRSFSPDLQIARLPCPHDGARNDRRPTALRRIGFFGHQRPERGVDLMPQLVTALLERGFEVVVQDSSAMIKQGGKHPRLVVLPFVADFPAEIARCDVVLWPSRWECYTGAFSGVVSECIATGVPVILPSGCLPANLTARFRCGILFHDFSVDAILEAVDEAAKQFPSVVAQAHAAATRWRGVNGTDRLLDWIEAHSAALSASSPAASASPPKALFP